MLALFRNPLLLLLVRLWWLPALTLLAAWGLGGERGWRWASNGIVAYLAAVAAMICAAWARGAFAAMRERARLRSAQHRFLCPQCLHFGGFHFACGACSKSVEDFLVHTGGDYVNDCRHCKAELLAHVQARCEHCQHTCDRAVYHQRQVHVLAALLPDDFTALRQILSTEEKQAQGNLAYTCKDDGTRLTYLVNLKSLPGKYDKKLALPRKHAVWELNSIWLDTAGDDKRVALEIGKAADPLISLTKTLTVCVPQTTLGDTVKNVLATRFQAIKYGVVATDFLGQATKKLPAAESALDFSATVGAIDELAVVSSAKTERASDQRASEGV